MDLQGNPINHLKHPMVFWCTWSAANHHSPRLFAHTPDDRLWEFSRVGGWPSNWWGYGLYPSMLPALIHIFIYLFIYLLFVYLCIVIWIYIYIYISIYIYHYIYIYRFRWECITVWGDPTGWSTFKSLIYWESSYRSFHFQQIQVTLW